MWVYLSKEIVGPGQSCYVGVDFFEKLLRISQSGRDWVRARISIIEKYVGVGESGLILG